MTTPNSTVIFLAACPTCQQIVTWMHHPQQPYPESQCTRPTCRVEQLVEK